MNQPVMIHPAQLAAALGGMNTAFEEVNDTKPKCPPASWAVGLVTAFMIESKYKAGYTMIAEYKVERSGSPDAFPAGLDASVVLGGLDSPDKQYRARQQVRLAQFLAAAYGMSIDGKGHVNGHPFDWVGFAVKVATNPSAPDGNAQLAILGRRFMVVTDPEKPSRHRDEQGNLKKFVAQSFRVAQ